MADASNTSALDHANQYTYSCASFPFLLQPLHPTAAPFHYLNVIISISTHTIRFLRAHACIHVVHMCVCVYVCCSLSSKIHQSTKRTNHQTVRQMKNYFHHSIDRSRIQQTNEGTTADKRHFLEVCLLISVIQPTDRLQSDKLQCCDTSFRSILFRWSDLVRNNIARAVIHIQTVQKRFTITHSRRVCTDDQNILLPSYQQFNLTIKRKRFFFRETKYIFPLKSVQIAV